MEIRHLQTFKTIIDVNGFTKAAQQLGYAQSTVTFHIKAIEDELGQPVFDRIGKTVVLTESGKHLLPHVLKILNTYKDLEEASSPSREVRGTIRIAAPEALLIYCFPTFIKEFKEKHPSVNIEIKHVNPMTLRKDLKEGKFDLAFILDKEMKSDEIIFNVVNQEPMMFLSPISSIQPIATLLEEQICLFSEEGCSYREVFQHLLKQYQVQTKKMMEFESIEMIKRCILQGFGISLLPYITVKEEIDQNKISAKEIDLDEPLFTQIAFHRDKWQGPSFKAFLTIFHKHASIGVS